MDDKSWFICRDCLLQFAKQVKTEQRARVVVAPSAPAPTPPAAKAPAGAKPTVPAPSPVAGRAASVSRPQLTKTGSQISFKILDGAFVKPATTSPAPAVVDESPDVSEDSDDDGLDADLLETQEFITVPVAKLMKSVNSRPNYADFVANAKRMTDTMRNSPPGRYAFADFDVVVFAPGNVGQAALRFKATTGVCDEEGRGGGGD
jgi:hypothetical protein